MPGYGRTQRLRTKAPGNAERRGKGAEMPEENTQNADENATKQQQTAGADNAAKTFTKEQVDEIVKQRLARAKREKPADYDELKKKAAELDEIKNQSDSELDKLQGRIDRLESENKSMKHAREVDEWKGEVANETGVPASILRGDTLEELQEHARAVKAAMPAYPQVDPGKPANAKLTPDQVDAIADPVERVKARARMLAQESL